MRIYLTGHLEIIVRSEVLDDEDGVVVIVGCGDDSGCGDV
jgi:hypothetical protein